MHIRQHLMGGASPALHSHHIQEVRIYGTCLHMEVLTIHHSTLVCIIIAKSGPFLDFRDGRKELLSRTQGHAKVIARTRHIEILGIWLMRAHPILHEGVGYQNHHKSQGYRESESLDSRIELVA